jgi:hypothetical protein
MRIISICHIGLPHKPGSMNPITSRLEVSPEHWLRCLRPKPALAAWDTIFARQPHH